MKQQAENTVPGVIPEQTARRFPCPRIAGDVAFYHHA
jgi:hypothetical protein